MTSERIMSAGADQDEIGEDELLRQIMFGDLMASKVDVRVPCSGCNGKGVKFGEVCAVCDGDKIVTQSMSLYALAKKLLPFFAHELRELLTQ